jgi:hypothetical protein
MDLDPRPDPHAEPRTDPQADPRALVAAPVRHALSTLIVRGLALVGLVGALAVWIVAASPDAAGRDASTFAAIALLAAYSLVVRSARMVHSRPSLEERASAWARALELDRDDAALALLVAAWVPAALFLALLVLLWPHLTDANPQVASSWAVFGLAAAGTAWLVMVDTWMDAARDDLARAEHEADLRFRRYWANPGR